MKVIDLIKPGVNIIICDSVYNIGNLKRYLLEQFTIVEYDTFILSNFSINKGSSTSSKPDIVLVDTKDKSVRDKDTIDYIANMIIETNSIGLFIIAYDDTWKDPKSYGKPLIYKAQTVLTHIMNNSYNVIKSRDVERNTIVSF